MKKDKEGILDRALKLYDLAVDAQSHNVKEWLDDMRFARMGEQWPTEIQRQRQLEGRPCLTFNKLPTFIRQVTNDARQNSPAIKFHPVSDGASRDVAEILDGLARNIEYTSNADVAYDTALDHAVTGGFGYFRIVTDYASDDVFEQDIRIERIENPLNVYPDAYAMGSDSADWNYCFITDLIKDEDFESRFPDSEKIDFNADSKDKPHWFEDSMIRIAEFWERKEVKKTLLKLSNGQVLFRDEYDEINADLLQIQGITIAEERETRSYQVTQYIINGKEVLETNEWEGKYIPIVPVYGDEIIIEGKRYFNSLIRFSKDAQRMYNYWRTTSTELIALAPKTPFIGAVGSFDTDAHKWATANTSSHAYIEYDPVPNGSPPVRQQFAGAPSGVIQEAMSASDDMKSIMGIYDAALGARSNETSGKAILARQRESDISTFNYIDNLSRAIRHAGRILCDLIPKIYSVPRVIRIIHEDGTNKNVQINQPFQPHDEDKMDGKELNDALVKLYDLTAGKYDVTCESGPSFTTKREEAANQMLQFIQSMPSTGSLIADKLVKNLDWEGADEIAERLKLMLPPQLQGKNPQIEQMQQQMQQMDMQAKEAVNALSKQLEEAKKDKTIEFEKLKIDSFNSETNRIKALNDNMTPEQIRNLVLSTMQEVANSGIQNQIQPEFNQLG